MNYPFLIHHLGWVPSLLFDELKSFVLSLPLYEQNNTNFDMRRHTGISGLVGPKQVQPLVIEKILDLSVLSWAKLAIFDDYQVNLFKAGGKVLPHVDQAANGPSVFLRQKIHIPIVGTENVDYTYIIDGVSTVFKLQHGGIYVFNDCVTHRLDNTGDVDRINVLIHWQDPMLTARDDLLKQIYDKRI